MAKKFKLDAEYYNMERRELAKVAKRLFENANRRIRNIEKNNLISPAYSAVMATGGQFYVKGSTTEELVKEIARCITFLNSDDGATVQSARKYTKAIENANPELTKGENRVKWEIYNKLKELNPVVFGSKYDRRNYDSDQILDEIERKIIKARKSVYGGVAGDMPGFSDIKSSFGNMAAAQENAIMSIIISMRKKFEDTVNGIIDTYDNKDFDFGFYRIHTDVKP